MSEIQPIKATKQSSRTNTYTNNSKPYMAEYKSIFEGDYECEGQMCFDDILKKDMEMLKNE